MDPESREHLPGPSVWPIGFAVGVATVLVGLIVNPTIISSIGGAITVVFGFLWVREATAEYRGKPIHVEPETRELRQPAAEPLPEPKPGERLTRSRFLEFSTLGLGGVIGGLITVPVAGLSIGSAFFGDSVKGHEVDLGPITDFPQSDKWMIATFMVDPAEGEVSRRTAFIRNNGLTPKGPSFTIISNRCAHLGCPVQANGPSAENIPIGKIVNEHTKNGVVRLVPAIPAGFGCPCHGGQYDTEGNRTAGPPVRALDRYEYKIVNGRLILGKTYSVSKVDGTGADALIHKYRLAGPGEHVSGIEQIFYPLQPPHG